MPHGARNKSSSGYYHVVPKDLRDQVIFEDDDDRRYYVSLLGEGAEAYDVRIHAYCLMSNHVHLVLEDLSDDLATFMKHVDERYATYFAQKLDILGGVLRKPYWSEPIESDAYLLCAVRYVHANPADAGLCKASAYDWSSAKDYIGRKGITYTDTVLSMTGGVEGFVAFSQAGNGTATAFPGSKLKHHLTDDEAARIAGAILGDAVYHLGARSAEVQRESLGKLKERGFSIAQSARITGIGRRRIEWLLRRY